MRRRYKETTYGQKGGEGPTRGKKAIVYTGTTPDGTPWKKRVFNERGGDTLIATGFMYNGKPSIVVWPGQPEWEGDFGRMVATRQV
jgi:hypothetical protein